ncbi:MAG TPA: hypothetical protein VF312_01315 [Propionibacteriaceae bacterium]
MTVKPGHAVSVSDTDAYGVIVVQGHGRLGTHTASATTLARFGQLTEDEFFVSESAAQAGLRIVNASQTEDLVLLKNFGPGNRSLP